MYVHAGILGGWLLRVAAAAKPGNTLFLQDGKGLQPMTGKRQKL
jgi:hypothetical protein